jgi:hypothetical protein
MNNELKKYALRDEHCDVDWQRQRVAINERIAERAGHPHHRARQFAFATAAVAVIAALIWFGTDYSLERRAKALDVAAFEQEIDNIIAGRLPDELYVVNGWTDVDITDWETTPAAYDPFGTSGNGSNGTGEEAL